MAMTFRPKAALRAVEFRAHRTSLCTEPYNE